MKQVGFLNIDKPKGITSHDVIDMIRTITGIRKVGHTGTLDPIASGVLVVALGKATRLIEYLVEGNKKYRVGFKIGVISDTFDIEGSVQILENTKTPTQEELTTVIDNYIGEIEQTPPQYSAIKVNGTRAYKLARAGKTAQIKPRTIVIYGIELVESNPPNYVLDVECSKGTYIRSLINDIGSDLGTGAVITDLTRTFNSGFNLEHSLDLGDLTANNYQENLIPPYDLFNDKSVIVQNEQVSKIKYGKNITLEDSHPETLFAFDNSQDLVAVLVNTGDSYKPHKVFI